MDSSLLEPLTLRHCLTSSFNASIKSNGQKEFVSKYLPSSYSSSLPVPVGIPASLTETCLQGIDHVTELVRSKYVWEDRKTELLSKASGLDFLKLNLEHSSKVKIPHNVVELAQHVAEDPDPNFSGFYNWYYSNGCLNNFLYDDTFFLLYVHDNLPGVCLSTPLEVQRTKCNMDIEHSVFIKTGHNQRIHQVSVSNNLVAVMQKNCTSLFSVSRGRKKLKFKKVHQHFEDDDCIVSVSVSDLGKYCSLTTSNCLKLWSPEVKDDCISCVKIENETNDNWGSVKYVSNNILVATRSHVYLKDPRIKLTKNAQNWKSNGQGVCDIITMICNRSNNESCAYVGTVHSLFELDFRQGFTKQWTHMMEHPPMYDAVTPMSEASEGIFIASQHMNELCCIDSNLEMLPYMLPSPDETINELKLQGHFLDPLLSYRFHLSMTGITTIPNHQKDGAFVFRTNSVGDLFYQKISFKEECKVIPNKHDLDIETALAWEKIDRLSCKTRDPLSVSSVINFDDFRPLTKRRLGKLSKKEQHDNTLDMLSERKFVVDESDNVSKSLMDVWGYNGSEIYNPDCDYKSSFKMHVIGDTVKKRFISSTPYEAEKKAKVTAESCEPLAIKFNETFTPIRKEKRKTSTVLNNGSSKTDISDESGNNGNEIPEMNSSVLKVKVLGKKSKRFLSGF